MPETAPRPGSDDGRADRLARGGASSASTRTSGRLDTRLATAHDDESEGLTWLSGSRIADLIWAGEISCAEATAHFLDRIEDLDGALRAFRMVDPAGAREQAARQDQALRNGEAPGPLCGVPIAIKEHIPVEGLVWHNLATGGKAIAHRDAVEAERLRAAGAIIIGSLVAGGAELGDTDDPRNPWDLERVPGISSPGAAAAVAAGLIPVAIAADGLGSTRLPAAFCGVLGLHPTRGRVPSFAAEVMNPRLLTTTGPIARNPRDAAAILQVLAGPDGRDFVCLQDIPPNYLADIDEGCAGMRLVWTEDFGYAAKYARNESAAVRNTVRSFAFSAAEDAGARMCSTDAIWEDPGWAGLQVYTTDPVIVRNSAVDEQEVMRCREIRRRIWDRFNAVLEGNDFIVSPTSQSIAPTKDDWTESWRTIEFMHSYAAYTAAANLIGWPALSLPAGLVEGMPVGLQIIGKPNSEAGMFKLAQSLLVQNERRQRGARPDGD